LKTDELKFVKNQKNMPKLQRDHKIDVLVRRIKTLNTKIESVQEKIKSSSKDLCQICLQQFTKPCITPCCDTIFCFECLVQSVSSNCLVCTEKISIKQLKLINNNKNDENNNSKDLKTKVIKVRNKFEMLKEILINNKNKRMLIFSEYDETFHKIERILDELNIRYSQLKGSVVNIIKNFEESTIQVLMLNAKYTGAGLNLQCADITILFNRFKKEREEQAIGRAHRLGRKNPLDLYYLVHEGEAIDDLNNNQMDNMDFINNIKADDEDDDDRPKKKNNKIIDNTVKQNNDNKVMDFNLSDDDIQEKKIVKKVSNEHIRGRKLLARAIKKNNTKLSESSESSESSKSNSSDESNESDESDKSNESDKSGESDESSESEDEIYKRILNKRKNNLIKDV
jgi:SNF2 family DNA or RNA helicase